MDNVNIVLFVVYLAGIEKIIDNNVELQNIKRMEDRGCGSKINY